jgi:hypothetical protein
MNERMHGRIIERTILYVPGTMVSVCVFSHVLKMDDALIGAMSCVSKILSSFVYAFSNTDWQIYLGTQPCMSNTLSTRSLRAQIYVPTFYVSQKILHIYVRSLCLILDYQSIIYTKLISIAKFIQVITIKIISCYIANIAECGTFVQTSFNWF